MSEPTWPYTLERYSSGWSWTLSRRERDLTCWSGWSFTKRGAMFSMNRIKRHEARRLRTKETGNL